MGSLLLIKQVYSGEGSTQQNLPKELKNELKSALLQGLIIPDHQLKKTFSSCLACISVYEFQQKEWLDLIPIFANNLSHQDLNIKKAAIMTLGFMCEQLKEKNLNGLLENDKTEDILKGILLGMSKQETDSEVVK